ncbi:MAG: TonB-dependent receptor [Halioglobus sp.]|nr:TonB-dependent receptor [Halioglobus sp.]
MRTKPYFIPIAVMMLLCSLWAQADHLEELVVTASQNTRTIDVADELLISSDLAQLLKKAPGGNVNTNGPLTGIPQYRGMFGSRIAVSMDGTHLAPSGPNWMDPPMSYAVGGQLESLKIYRGIVPVSVAQESIGGAIDVKSIEGEFSKEEEFAIGGRLMSNVQSVNDAYHLESAVYASNKHNRVRIAAMTEKGDDAEFPNGKIRPTEYERQRYDLGYGFRTGNHTAQLSYGYNDTGDSGTPALPTDIETIKGDLYSLRYNFDRNEVVNITVALFSSNLDHTMTNYLLREAPATSQWRRISASSDNMGFKLMTTVFDTMGSSTFGFDGFNAKHDADVDNPNNPMFFIETFNHAKREVLGAFFERTENFNTHWSGEFGIRFNRVEMDANEVNATPSMMMPAAASLRDAFNNAKLRQVDNNLDLAAKAWFQSTNHTKWYLGVAQKNRSPSYQERYLWLPLQATAGLADGYTYTGTVALNPEVSRQIESGLNYSSDTLTLSPRIFYSKVKDFIQGTKSEDPAAIAFVRMMNAQNGTNNPDPLQFSNVDAELYGFDMDWFWHLSQQWSASGLINYVRGERDDSSDDNLYRIAPPNATVRLTYTAPAWTATLEAVGYAKQDNVSAVNDEQESSSYGLINLNATWDATKNLQLAAGVDNVLDKRYEAHLGGYNRAINPDIALGARLPSSGTNIFARVMYRF